MIPEIIAGALVSLVVQGVKKYTKSSGMTSLAILLAVSILGAFIYQWLVYAGYWEAVVTLFASAATIYAVVLTAYKASKKGE